MTYTKSKRIGFRIFDGVQALDLFGPVDAFQETNEILAEPKKHYEIVLVSYDDGPVLMLSGVKIEAHTSTENCSPLHTFIIPGGAGTRATGFPEGVIE
jgi:putative intracellular protease/amidase